ncbi:MAG TPA: ribonuclease III [Nitrospirae bacterium]|nr:ribonuclease 3 [bacterium BMS3Bbin09]HDO66600.1 ribonuclease III [Nitrospirota bacterium]HEW80774.1 ribonuclease III [Nitrospirota bacterium]
MDALSSRDLISLEKALGHTFKKKALLKEAITHKSYAHEKQDSHVLFNERMEFLGDAVLELIISEHLYSANLEYTEADLSKIKAYAVQESTLAEIAEKLDIGKALLLGKGEELTGGREKPSLLSNGFEAILAAIYLDGGYERSRIFVIDQLKGKMDDFTKNKLVFDFKTKLQEIAQAEFGILPTYVTHKEEGPEHSKTFEVNVFINDNFLGEGAGKTKKAAAQKAAEAALKRIEADKEKI